MGLLSRLRRRSAPVRDEKAVIVGEGVIRGGGVNGSHDGDLFRRAITPFIGRTWAKKRVTVDDALQLSTAWSCIRLLAETIGTFPFGVYERTTSGAKAQVHSHPLSNLVGLEPNADQTALEFWEGHGGFLGLWGNAYSELERSAGDRVVAMTPLRPDMMQPFRRDNGTVAYRYFEPGRIKAEQRQGNRRRLEQDAGAIVFEEEDIFHVKGFGLSGLAGLSPISFARQTMATAMATDEAAASTFANGLRASGFFQFPNILTDPNRELFRKRMEEFVGSENAGRFMILEGGMQWNALSLPPEDAQMLQTRAFHVEEICRWFRVPPILVGHSAQGQTMWGSGIEKILIAFLQFSLLPYLKRIEKSANRRLLTPAERGRFFFEFNFEGLLRADSKARAEFISKMVQNGIYTRNEVRGFENKEPKTGGDDLTVQSNMVPLSALPAIAEGIAKRGLTQTAETPKEGDQ